MLRRKIVCSLMHSLSLFFKKITRKRCLLPRKEVSQLKMKLSRLHPHMFLLVQPRHLQSQLPEASWGKWSLATPSRAAPHSPTLTHPAGTLCASPAMAGWGHKWLGKQIVLLMAGRWRIGLTQGFQPCVLQLQVCYVMFNCLEESTHVSTGAPGSVL